MEAVVTVDGYGDVAALQERLRQEIWVSHITYHGVDTFHRLQIGVDDGDGRLAPIVTLATATYFHVQHISVNKPSLADVFMAYTGYESEGCRGGVE